MNAAAPVARLAGVGLRYGARTALDSVTLDIPAGCMAGLIGPDGVGKSSLLALLAGARRIQAGSVQVLGLDMRTTRERDAACPRIAYMPQGLGRNLYPTLSVEENLQFFGRLFGHGTAERRRRIDVLCASTGLLPFLARPVAQLSGGMKQKLGLCCALIHDPDLLVLDEPTTGVDPLSRAQFWRLIAQIRAGRPGMSVVVATAYMEEAQAFDWLAAMDGGRVLATGAPHDLCARTSATTLEQAFIALLPEQRRAGHRPPDATLPPSTGGSAEPAIEAHGLSMRFGDFTAVDRVDLQIRRGEIFGFLGSNGCGKTTTMKLLTGLLEPSEGQARVFGQSVGRSDHAIRSRVGYMTQSFSLYGELTVRQNLELHARLFDVAPAEIAPRVLEMTRRFGLADVQDRLPQALPLGMRQRLSLAVAMVHKPELLILDEPTSGVDPIARDLFWTLMIELARRDGVTIFISTHFMNEALRCDRISLMHAGRVLVTDTPQAITAARGAQTLEQAFVAYLSDAAGEEQPAVATQPVQPVQPALAAPARDGGTRPARGWFSPRRALSFSLRELIELRRDPLRATLAMLGTAILMCIIGYGISLDVENLSFAVLDQDQTTLSHNYVARLAGSRYFTERAPLADHAGLDRRMRAGEIALAVEIPHGFARDVARGHPAQIAAWVDGAMPARAETARGYVQAMHQLWLQEMARERIGTQPAPASTVELRYRYNPDVKSLPAMVPAVIPMLLMMIPAMLTALSVVREKELGSIFNLYVTPVTRSEFLIGKQLPYLALGMLNFLLMCLMAVTLFDVPMKGSFGALALAAVIYVASATGLGMLASTFTRTQISALFVTVMGTLVPCVQFSGLIDPVSSLEGMGAAIGRVYPAAHFLTVSRGVFAKALTLHDLWGSLWPLVASVPVIVGLAIALLPKQDR